VNACVVFGEHDDTGLADEERHGLEECPRVRLVTIPGAGHFTMVQEPGRIAEMVLEMVAAEGRR
jgi:pimeloyl-ACP methyl ester carboxylesterase